MQRRAPAPARPRPPDRRSRRLRGAQRVGPGHLRRQVGQRAHAGARALPAPPRARAAWVEQAETVEHERTNSELGALLLESRLIKRLRPPGNARLKHIDRYVYLRCRLDIAFPVLEVAPAPAAGRGVSVGPLRGRAAAVELLEQLNSLFGLRHCARKLPRRYWPSAYGQMGRCLSPCLGDLDPNLYRRRLDEALALFTGEGDGGAALLAHLDEQMRARRRRAELRARRLAAPPARAPGVAARAPGRRAGRHARAPAAGAGRASRAAGAATRSGSSAGAWSTGGRRATSTRSWSAPCARCAAATAPAPPRAWRPTRSTRRGSSSTWLDAHDAPALDLHGGADRAAVARLLASAHEDGHAHAGRVQRADDPVGAGARQPPREHAA